jgi:riboflavin transporter FmnP
MAGPPLGLARAAHQGGDMKVQQLVLCGMLAGVAFLLMATVQVPLLPAAPYLRYDPSDAAGLLAGVLYGPAAGVAVVAVKSILYFFLRSKGPFGPIADFIAASTFVFVTAWMFRRGSGPFVRRLVVAAVVGAAARVLIMIPANYILLNLQFGFGPARVTAMLPAVSLFNAVKAALNAGLALVVAEPFTRRALPDLATGEGKHA